MTSEQLAGFLPILLIVLAFWFLVIRPARKRQSQAQQLQNRIAIGDRVMLTSGIFGRVVGLDDETLELEIASGVVITALRPAVARVVEPPTGDADGPDAANSGEATGGADAGRTDGKDAPA